MGLGLSDQHIVDLGMGNKRLLVTEAMAKRMDTGEREKIFGAQEEGTI